MAPFAIIGKTVYKTIWVEREVRKLKLKYKWRFPEERAADTELRHCH